MALLLPLEFLALLGTYYAVTLAYSLHLKQVAMLDVLLLAGLYTVRIFGGSLAVGVPTSSWLLTFSMFLFFSLALVKRLSEVRRLRLASEAAAPGQVNEDPLVFALRDKVSYAVGLIAAGVLLVAA